MLLKNQVWDVKGNARVETRAAQYVEVDWISGAGRAAVGLRRADWGNDDGWVERRWDVAGYAPEWSRNLEPVERHELKLREAAQAALARLRFQGMAAHRADGRRGAWFFPSTGPSGARTGTGNRGRAAPSGYASWRWRGEYQDQQHGSDGSPAHGINCLTCQRLKSYRPWR